MSAFKILIGKPTGSPGCGWEYNFRMDLKDRNQYKELVWFGRIGLLETPCECGIEPPGSKSHGDLT